MTLDWRVGSRDLPSILRGARTPSGKNSGANGCVLSFIASERICCLNTILGLRIFYRRFPLGKEPGQFGNDRRAILAAEFVAKRVTGRITQQDALDYVLKYEREVWERFRPQMMGRDTSGWMWSKPSDPDQPRDIAYALGSRIVEAYYNKATDKRQAMQEILSVTNYPSFLEESGYGQHGER